MDHRLKKCQDIVTALANSVDSVRNGKPHVSSSNKEARLTELMVHLAAHHIQVTCDLCSDNGVEGTARAYASIDKGFQITLCANRLRPGDVHEALLHEAVHAHDHLNRTADLTTLDGLAYSEIRAAREAECSDRWPILREGCIRDKASRATRNVFPTMASQPAVMRTFEQAMADERPWKP